MEPSQYQTLYAKTGLTEFPAWGNEIVLRPEEVSHYYYYTTLDPEKTTEKEVPLAKIIGTTHASYYGLSWNDMLLNLRRSIVGSVQEAYNEFDKPTFEHDRVSLAQYGDNYFISGGGNHRTCLAKFGSRKTVRTLVTTYTFDHELFEALNYLKTFFLFSEYDSSYRLFNSSQISVSTRGRREAINFASYFRQLTMNEAQRKIHSVGSLFERSLSACLSWAFDIRGNKEEICVPYSSNLNEHKTALWIIKSRADQNA